ncbi:uncharacterized protein [Spinacia oleracea]|uniref:Reverse transcriptase domain-containing protein n=1 Tax=Spinacia oleracea TaxID=3562 RepID=A0ABM3R7P7_SPIOL|nr:uncharacterized protein LOC130467223 [Spinacia oleracea]
MFSLSAKLSALRRFLLSWCVHNRRAWGINWRDLTSAVSSAALSVTSGPSTALFISSKDEFVARAEATFLYWKQRSKIKWDVLGDSPSRLFFSSVQARKRRNYISGLWNDSDQWIQSPPAIRTLVLSFYSNLYQVDGAPVSSPDFDWDQLQLPHLLDSQIQGLMCPFSSEDIRKAMFSIADGKSPGPDGFSAALFKFHWDKVGSHVIMAVQYFFAHGFMLKDWNRTFLVLLPKVDHPDKVSQFRLIGLCNVVYKGIAKCLTHRLQSVMSSLTSETQNAFVPGRLMSDDCLLAHELISFVNNCRNKKKFYVAVKLDMNKAYDRILRDFLFKTLEVFGFPPYWIHIISQCVSTVSYQVLVNGKPTSSFRPRCGLRQGDPLSPYLFVLCMEVFSASLRLAERQHLLRGISICRNAPSISHLFFADDSLLFFEVSPDACHEVTLVLDQFSLLSGQLVNYQKSFVKFSPNTPDDYRDFLSSCLRLGHRPHLGKYLGVQVDLGRSKCSAFYDLVDRIARRISNFASLRLSTAAKLVLINSVLVASISHVLLVFQIPQSICDRIDQLCLRFWWRSSPSSSGMALRSASLLHLPKGMGGLGIRKVSSFNQALLARQAWRLFHQPQLLLSRLYRAKYPHLLALGPTSPSRPSWGCRGLMSGVKVFSQGLAWKVGSGSQVKITLDSWVPDAPITFRSSVNESEVLTHVSSLVNLRSYAWDIAVIRHLFVDATANAILALERPSVPLDDFVYWKFTPAGLHSSAHLPCLPVTWWKQFWGLKILPRFKIFVWKLMHNALPVAGLLHNRGIPLDPQCSFCHSFVESVAHLFRNCPLISAWWSISSLASLCALPLPSSFSSWCASIISRVLVLPPPVLGAFLVGLWSCWIVRNDIRFRESSFSMAALDAVFGKWSVRLADVVSFRSPLSSHRPGPILNVGHPLFFSRHHSSSLSPVICLVVDGEWVLGSNQAGVAWVFKDARSLVALGGGAQACILGSALQAELRACARPSCCDSEGFFFSVDLYGLLFFGSHFARCYVASCVSCLVAC